MHESIFQFFHRDTKSFQNEVSEFFTAHCLLQILYIKIVKNTEPFTYIQFQTEPLGNLHLDICEKLD